VIAPLGAGRTARGQGTTLPSFRCGRDPDGSRQVASSKPHLIDVGAGCGGVSVGGTGDGEAPSGPVALGHAIPGKGRTGVGQANTLATSISSSIVSAVRYPDIDPLLSDDLGPTPLLLHHNVVTMRHSSPRRMDVRALNVLACGVFSLNTRSFALTVIEF